MVKMEPTKPNYLDPTVLAQVEGLALRARWAVEGFLSGEHRSPFRGQSVEFAQHRQYTPGDDLRRLDWKVFARTDKYYLKQYEEETNLAAHLVLDISRSMTYRSESAPMSKLDYARATAAALAYLILGQRDRVGLAVFDNGLSKYVPPNGSPSHFKGLVATMEAVSSEEKTSLARVFHDLAERIDRRGIVIVLSDLFDDVDTMMAGLKHLRFQRHEVILLHVLDPAEIDFSLEGNVQFDDLETDATVTTQMDEIREAYLDQFDQYRQAIHEGCRRYGIDYVAMRTDRPIDQALSNYLLRRAAMRRTISFDAR